MLQIDIASARGRLVDLTTLPMRTIDGGEVFGLSMPPRLLGGDIHLHAPVAVEFQLPLGAARLALVAELTDQTDERVMAGEDSGPSAWADLDLMVQTEDGPLTRHHLDVRQPHAEINIALTGRTLMIELDPAANGPVMDRIALRRRLVFVAFE